jgi:hypothetical protein
MLLRHVYLISLEDANRWPMWFGLPVGETQMDTFTVDLARAYFAGLTSSAVDIDPDADDLTPFFTWLRDVRGAFPARGWCAEYLAQSGGDHFAAMQTLFDYLYEYVTQSPPDWFLKLNATPVPSQVRNGHGTPQRDDVRKPEHVTLAGK